MLKDAGSANCKAVSGDARLGISVRMPSYRVDVASGHQDR